MAIGVFDAGRGAALSRDSALAWYGIPGHRLGGLPEVTMPHRTRPLATDLARTYDSLWLPPHHVVDVRGIPVVTPERLLLDVGAEFCEPHRHEFGAQRLLGIAHHLLRLRLLDRGRLDALVEEMSARGRAGMTPLRLMLDHLGDDEAEPLPESSLESRLESLLRRSGRCGYRRQRQVVGDRGWLGRVDFERDDPSVVLEANSMAFHGDPIAVGRDVVRYRRLLDAGRSVAAVWEDDIWHDPDGVLAAVDTAERSPTPVLVHSPSMPDTWLAFLDSSDIRIARPHVRSSYRNGVGIASVG